MADSTSDPAQDAGLVSPPIQGIDEGVVKSGDEETAHIPIPPEKELQGQGTPSLPLAIEDPYAVKTTHDEYHPPVTNLPEVGQQGQETQAPSTTEQPDSATSTDATGDNSSDLA